MAAVEKQSRPKDSQLAKVYDFLTGEKDDDRVEYVVSLLDSPMARDRIVAFFLSGATLPEISKSLWIPIEVLELFQWLYVNKDEFRHKLEIYQYAQEYMRNVCEEENEEWLKLGLEIGPLALIYKHLHGHENLPIDARMLTREMINQAFHLSMLARGNQITSSVAKEAYKWMGSASRMALSYDKLGLDDTAEDEALVAIERRKMTRTPEEAEVPPDTILH